MFMLKEINPVEEVFCVGIYPTYDDAVAEIPDDDRYVCNDYDIDEIRHSTGKMVECDEEYAPRHLRTADIITEIEGVIDFLCDALSISKEFVVEVAKIAEKAKKWIDKIHLQIPRPEFHVRDSLITMLGMDPMNPVWRFAQ